MKICVIFSSYEGSDSPFQAFDEYQDPSRYTNAHDFICKYIRKESAMAELDEICSGGDYDFYWSFLWGSPHDSVAGLDALKHLESKALPLLGTSSKFLAMTKVDVKKLISAQGIKTPAWSLSSHKNIDGMKFPLIVKPIGGLGSLHMTRDSLCTNKDQLLEQLTLLQTKVNGEILIEEYIVGNEVSVMVVETHSGTVSLPPLIYTFPSHWKPTEKFLDFDSKFHKMESGEIKCSIYEEQDQDLLRQIRETAVKAYEALGVLGSGYARVDFRVTPEGDVYVLEVNPAPAFFSKPGNTFGDDMVIEMKFPGGHEGLVDTIIGAKGRLNKIISNYDSVSGKYDELYASVRSHVKDLIQRFNFDGSVLDIGCGTGLVGRFIAKKHPGVTLTGIDVSSKMAQLASGSYSSVKIGMVENVLMDSELDCSFDHVISFGVFPFIDPSSFVKVLSRMFCVAKSSVTFSIEDIPPEYNEILIKANAAEMVSFNHVKAIEQFEAPPGWELVYKNRGFMWDSPNTGIKIYGLNLRFENLRKKIAVP